MEKVEKMLLTVREFMNRTGLSYRSALALVHRDDAPVIWNGKQALLVASELGPWLARLGREHVQISE